MIKFIRIRNVQFVGVKKAHSAYIHRKSWLVKKNGKCLTSFTKLTQFQFSIYGNVNVYITPMTTYVEELGICLNSIQLKLIINLELYYAHSLYLSFTLELQCSLIKLKYSCLYSFCSCLHFINPSLQFEDLRRRKVIILQSGIRNHN